MNYSTVYVGMDVHKESVSLCCYTNEKETAEYHQKVEGHYSKILNYLEAMRFHPDFATCFILTIEKNVENTAFGLYFFTFYVIIIYRVIGM